MLTLMCKLLRVRNFTRWFVGLAGVAVLAFAALPVMADAPYTMAPPIDAVAPPKDAPTQDNVFNWTEIPKNEDVVITRGVFDKGGYQLFDTKGETIVVPFTDNNLYVMKFAVSDTDNMYLVATESAPVLYVPKGGYLENATVPGARWYPFSKDFHPEEPVYVGIAPSWDAYIGMGWYPGMYCWGGYWCSDPFFIGAFFAPEFGFFIEFGGHHWYGWNSYNAYCFRHPAPYGMGFWNRDVYGWGNHHDWSSHAFYGTGHAYYGGDSHFGGAGSHVGSVGGGRTFYGAGHPYIVGGHDSGSFGSHDSGSFGSHDSGGLSSHDSGGLSSHDSGGLSSHGSGGVGSHDSGSFGSHDSGSFGSHDSGSFGGHDNGGFDSRDSGSFGGHDNGGFDSRDSGGFGGGGGFGGHDGGGGFGGGRGR